MNRLVSFALLVAVSFTLSGCLLLAAGGGGLAGYQLSKSDQPGGGADR